MAKELVRVRIDLSGISGYVDDEENDIVRQELGNAGLLSSNRIYTVFNLAREERVERTGLTTDPREKIFYGFEMDQLVWDNWKPNCLKVLTRQYLEPGIAVFDRKQLLKADVSNSEFGYEFIEKQRARDALIGIAQVIIS